MIVISSSSSSGRRRLATEQAGLARKGRCERELLLLLLGRSTAAGIHARLLACLLILDYYLLLGYGLDLFCCLLEWTTTSPLLRAFLFMVYQARIIRSSD